MNNLREAAQQALEALEWHYAQGHSNTLGGFRLKIDEKAIRTLKTALEQPKQDSKGCDYCNHPLYAAIKCRSCGRVTEPAALTVVEPVAWGCFKDGVLQTELIDDNKRVVDFWIASDEPHMQGMTIKPLYTHPPRKPLTDEQQAREIEALRADAERLDWCMERLFDPDRGYLTTDMGCGCCGDGLRFKGLDGRAAIDAAIKAGKAVTP